MLKKKYQNTERLSDVSRITQLGAVTLPPSARSQGSWLRWGAGRPDYKHALCSWRRSGESSGPHLPYRCSSPGITQAHLAMGPCTCMDLVEGKWCSCSLWIFQRIWRKIIHIYDIYIHTHIYVIYTYTHTYMNGINLVKEKVVANKLRVI